MEKKKHRFAPKVYGRGIVPISREGWLFTLALVGVIVLGSLLILGPEEDPETKKVILFFVFILIASLVPIYLLKERIQGTLKWRRGAKDIDRDSDE